METLDKSLPDLLALLQEVTRTGAPPCTARQMLRERTPADTPVVPQLLWNRVSFGAGWQYEVLIPIPGEGTAMLTFCPDDGVPWNLRNAFHQHEQDIVRVNNEAFTVGSAIAMLDTLWDEARLVARFVEHVLIGQAQHEHQIEVRDDELQEEMNRFRRRKGLFNADVMRDWLAANGMKQQTLEQYLQGEVATRKLRDIVTGPDVDAYFATHRAKFELVRAARLHVSVEQKDSVAIALNATGGNFYAVAENLFREDGANRGLSFVTLRCGKMSAAQAEIVFAAEPGQVVGPVPSGRGFDFLKVLDRAEAELDAETQEAVRDALFAEWLDTKRKAAAIEWYWGYAEPQVMTQPA